MSTETQGGSVGPAFVDLPEAVRSRVVALAARVLPQVGSLPAGLRRVADFAPARRARLGAAAISAALDDEELRERVGVQVAAGPAPDAGDEAAVAAYAWLTRPEGWEDTVARYRESVPREDDEVERLRTRLAVAEQAVRDARAKVRAQLEELKAENTALRRKLGQSRVDERAAREEAEQARRTAADATAAVEVATSAQEKELRRLRARIEQLEAEASTRRRSERSDRDEATLRARVLLETVVDAATGLRRELGLPQVAGAPGDRVEAAIAEAGGSAAAVVSPGGSGPGSVALLEQLLGMPRSRLIIDGYNVSKTAWPDSSLEAQRVRLLTTLAPLVARTGAETTVVFDAATATSRPVVRTPRGVKVLFSPAGVIADDVIRELVGAEPPGRVVVVITGDQAIVRDVGAAGARAMAAETLLAATS